MAAALVVPGRAPQVVPTEVVVADAYRPTEPCDQKHCGLSLASAFPVIVLRSVASGQQASASTA